MTLSLHHFTFKAMACLNEIFLYSESKQKARDVAERAIESVNRLEHRYSRYIPSSILSKINASAGDKAGITVDQETASLLDYANTCYQHSDGLFDVTSGVLRRVWDFKRKKLPQQQDIDSVLRLIGWQKIIWSTPTITLPLSGMELDFGGVVKEYAADYCANLCHTQGIIHGMVNMGGDIHVIGPHPDGQPWKIGIQDPRNPDEIITSVDLKYGGLASSGDYQRCIVIDGHRYGHILNPKTGWPVRGLRSVSVIAPHCLIAGSTSTIAMLKGEGGKHWLDDTGLSYIWIDEKGELVVHAN